MTVNFCTNDVDYNIFGGIFLLPVTLTIQNSYGPHTHAWISNNVAYQCRNLYTFDVCVTVHL